MVYTDYLSDEPADAPFWVVRASINSISESLSRTCPPGEQCYIVKCRDLNEDVVRKIWDFALRLTDESEHAHSAGHCYWIDDEAEFNIGHSIEHLAVLDLIRRDKTNLALGGKMFCAARTVKIHGGNPEGAVIFYFRKGLAVSPEEELASVEHAITEAEDILSREDMKKCGD